MASGHSAIEARGVTKVFQSSGQEPFKALDNVFVTIRENEFFTLLGPSGCGKTTLLRLIAGFDFPTEGEIWLHGENIAPLPPFKRPVNTVFQSYALFPHLTVAQNIGFGLQMQGKPAAEIAARTAKMLALVKLEAMAGRKTSQLSGGQQQRVALARALAPQPKVLLLDEPLSALDLKLRKEMQTELKRLQRETGITFIFVTHDQEEALTMSDRIGVMAGGHIQQVGAPKDIYTHPVNRFVADFIGETNFLAVDIRDGKAMLPGGLAVPVQCASSKATVTIRPEQLRIVAAGTPETMLATVEHSVYFGTDSHVHLKLADGTAVTVRVPASETANAPAAGTAVGLAINPGAVQALED